MKQNKSQPKLKKISRLVIEVEKVFKGIRNKEPVHVRDKILSSVIDSMSEGLAVHEIVYDNYGKAVDYILTEVNISFEKITGLKRDEIIGKPASEIYSVKKAPYLDIYSQVESSGNPATFETFFPPMKKYFTVSAFSPGKGKFATIFQDITERKIMEETLRESEKKYRELILHAPSGIYEVDFRTRMFTTVNDSMCLLTGYSREELLSMNPFEILDEDGRMAFQVRINKWLSGEKPDENVEYNVRAKDGHIICALLNVKFKTDKDGKSIGALVVAHDITERKKAEQALIESEQNFKLLFETMLQGAVYQDVAGKIISMNPAAELILGKTPEEFIGSSSIQEEHNTIKIDGSPFPGSEHPAMISLRTGKRIHDVVMGVYNQHIQDYRWINIEAIPLFRVGETKPYQVCTIFSDITEHKLAEEELRNTLQRFYLMLASMYSGVLLMAEDGCIELVNQAFCNYYGLTETPSDLKGLTSAELLEKIKNAYLNPVEAADRIREILQLKQPVRGEEFEMTGGRTALRDFIPLNVQGKSCGSLWIHIDITELKKTVLALQESEDRFRTIAETVPALVCITRIEDSTVMFTNEYNNKAFGLTGEDIIGTQGPDYYYDPDDRVKMINLFSEKGFVDNYQLKVKKSDGSPFWIITSVHPIIYKNQSAIIGASIDITEYKKIEEELKKSEQLYRAIGESIDFGVWVCEPDGRNVYASESYLKLVGLTQEQCSSFGWGDTLHPDDAERTLTAWKECVRTGGKWDIEHRFKGVDGKWHPILARGIPIRDEQGNITAWAGINLDIANLKSAEDKLMQTQKKLSVILDNSNIGTWDWDLKSEEVSIHEGAKQILGLEPGKSVKTQEEFENLIHEEDIYHVQKAFNRTIEQGFPLDTIFRLKSNNRFISFKASIIKDNKETPVLISGICFDISDIKKSTEETLVKLSEELLRSNKELENFAYVASHDLQEPLRMVSSFTQLLALHYKDKLDDRAQEYIYFAVDGAKRMYDLLNGLLAYSRIHTKGKAFTQVDVNQIMANVIKNLALNIKERGAVIKIDELPVISADETQMIQLFQNLIANSIKFSPGFPKIFVSSKLEGDQYIFSVKDEGIGIESQYFDKIFQIFQRLLPKEQYEGTGIGLAMCKRIVERHGGKIWVESEPEAGSTFYFTIPKNNQV